MVHIPHEILSSIVEYFNAHVAGSQKLSEYATVSREWQIAVERITFRSLQIVGSDLNTFAKAFHDKNIVRRGYLRSIAIQCIFDRNQGGCCQVTRTVNRKADSRLWSSLITRLFSTLENLSLRYTAQFQAPPSISMVFDSAGRGKDAGGAPLVGHRIRCIDVEHTTKELEAARRRPGTILFEETGPLPSLLDVSSLQIYVRGESWYLHPAWIGKLILKLPLLQTLDLELEDPYDWGSDWRKQYQFGKYLLFEPPPQSWNLLTS